MDKKKILIVCQAFYPSNSPRSHRATELAKEFALQGHEVTVLMPKDLKVHSTFEKEHQVTIKDLGLLRWKSPDFGKSKFGYFLTRSFYRLLSLAFEYPDIELTCLVNKGLKNEQGYDLLISIAVPYPIHWGIARAWKKNQQIAKKWVADCGDPYMGNTTDSFKKWFHFSYIEKWFMRKADFISIPVESARKAYFDEFHPKIKVIPQGFKIEPVNVSGTFQNSVPTFIYAGGFIPGLRDPRPLLEFLSSVDSDFLFIIYTNNPDLIKSYKSKLGRRLEIRAYVTRPELLKVLSEADFLVNFDNNTTTAVPSKLIDYAISGRPVLNIESTFERQRVIRFLNGDYSDAMKFASIEDYKIENVCRSFLALLN